jgi:hypothetical protein
MQLIKMHNIISSLLILLGVATLTITTRQFDRVDLTRWDLDPNECLDQPGNETHIQLQDSVTHIKKKVTVNRFGERCGTKICIFLHSIFKNSH